MSKLSATKKIENTSTSIDEPSNIASLIACPVCANSETSLMEVREYQQCPNCGSNFPVLNNGYARFPWLFPDPDCTLLEWKARFNGFLDKNKTEQSRLRGVLRSTNTSKIGRARIETLLKAKKDQRPRISELLAPLGLEDIDFDGISNATRILGSKLPNTQGLSSYYNNVFRDWSWNNGENEALTGVVNDVLKGDVRDSLGKLLTLGAGACRLSYDLHKSHAPQLSVVSDINPLLLFIASRVIHGQDVGLYEFPIAPLNKDSYAVLQTCHAPEPFDRYLSDRFQFVFADAMSPPFKTGSFDTVLTPWLIDIIPQNLSEFIPRINRLLSEDGLWINTGSLAFFHRDESWCYSEEELSELIERNGFEILAATRTAIPYLQSPLSAHGRTETVFSFSARKIRDVDLPPSYEYLPKWILNTNQPIPDAAEHAITSSEHLLRAHVLAAINGERSIEEIGSLVAKRYGLRLANAIQAVKRILIEVYESSLTRPIG